MTQVRWFLACALTLGLSGLAPAQQSPASASTPRTCPACATCPACCQDCPTASPAKPCCTVWQFVLRLGGVGVGISAQPVATAPCGAAACEACQRLTNNLKLSLPDSCCDQDIHEILGQCAPVEEAIEMRAGCCGTGCSACSMPQATAGCPCPAGACANACIPGCACTGERVQCENVVIIRGPNPSFVPAIPMAVSRVAVQGDQVRISTPDLNATGQRFSVTMPRMQGPLQISVKGKQLQIRTPTMQATCDQVTSLPTGPGHVLMEGNVKMTYHAPNTPTRVEANRILVDLNNNEFKVTGDNGPVVPANRVGLWYAPSPVSTMFPPAPPIPAFGFPLPMPHPVPMTTPVSRPVAPAVYYQPMPSSPSR